MAAEEASQLVTQVVDLDKVLQGQEVQTIQVTLVDEDGKLVNIDSDLFQVSHQPPPTRPTSVS